MILQNLLLVLFFATGLSTHAENKPHGGFLIDKALYNVLGALRQKSLNTERSNHSSLKSRIRRRCIDSLACEYHAPVVELDNVRFTGGQIYLHQLDTESQKAIDGLSGIHASKAGHLPSSLVQITQFAHDWIAGPKINVVDTAYVESCSAQDTVDTHAFFLFPWETNNAFHSLNDNVFAVLASIVLHYVTASEEDLLSAPAHKTLYVFNKIAAPTDQTLVYKLLHLLFEGDVQPAGHVLKGGPHCIRRVTWGTTIKPFYRDSLMDLRRATYDVFKEILRLRAGATADRLSSDITEFNDVRHLFGLDKRANSSSALLSLERVHDLRSKAPKVVIVTRNTTKPLDSPARKLSDASEALIVSVLRKRGIDAEICCDYRAVNSAERLVDHFLDVDICIGMHGAGLSNCALGARGMVVVELQMAHAFGFDSFMKIAHMAQGHYLFYDVRENDKVHGKGAGSVLSQSMVEGMVDLSLALLDHSQSHLASNTEAAAHIRRGSIIGQPKGNSRSVGGTTDFMVRGSRGLRELSGRDTKSSQVKPGPGPAKWQTETIARFNAHKRFVNSVMYRSEIVIDLAAAVVYFDTAAGPHVLDAVKQLMGSANRYHSSDFVRRSGGAVAAGGTNIGTVQYLFRPISEAVHNGSSQAITVENTFRNGGSGADGAGSNLLTKSGGEVFLVVLSPHSTTAYRKESILGPALKDNFKHCVSLPYYKFRTLTQIFKDHRGECDKAAILSKRSGGNDNLLLTKFI